MKTKVELKEDLRLHQEVARDRCRRAIVAACTHASDDAEAVLSREMSRWLWLSRVEVHLDEFFQDEEQQDLPAK